MNIRIIHTISEIGLNEITLLRPGQALIGKLDALANPGQVQIYVEKRVTAFAMELI